MRNIQEVFNQIQEKKKEMRDIKKMYRDALDSSGEYKELLEKIEQLKAAKKKLEVAAWDDAGSKNKFETSKLDIKQDRELLTDLAINSLMSGEPIKIVDAYNSEYEPKFSVSFKKTNVVNKTPA